MAYGAYTRGDRRRDCRSGRRRDRSPVVYTRSDCRGDRVCTTGDRFNRATRARRSPRRSLRPVASTIAPCIRHINCDLCVCVACRLFWTVCDTTPRLTVINITIHTSSMSGPRITDVSDLHDFALSRLTANASPEGSLRTNGNKSGSICQYHAFIALFRLTEHLL